MAILLHTQCPKLSKSFNWHSMNPNITQNCIKRKRRKKNLIWQGRGGEDGRHRSERRPGWKGLPVGGADDRPAVGWGPTADEDRDLVLGDEWKVWAFRRRWCRSRSGWTRRWRSTPGWRQLARCCRTGCRWRWGDLPTSRLVAPRFRFTQGPNQTVNTRLN